MKDLIMIYLQKIYLIRHKKAFLIMIYNHCQKIYMIIHLLFKDKQTMTMKNYIQNIKDVNMNKKIIKRKKYKKLII